MCAIVSAMSRLVRGSGVLYASRMSEARTDSSLLLLLPV
jgi:hypothetical protein